MTEIGEQLELITAELWSAMFSHDFTLAIGGDPVSGPQRTCLVWIEGDVQRAVLAQFPEGLAIALTQSLLGESSVPNSESIVDAIGELGNIIAGNVKACFHEHASLSLPTVTSGTDYAMTTVGAIQLAVRYFTTGGYSFAVSVLEAAPSAGKDA